MIVKVVFDLKDEDDKSSWEDFQKASLYRRLIEEWSEELRHYRKYSEDPSTTWNKIEEKWLELVRDLGC